MALVDKTPAADVVVLLDKVVHALAARMEGFACIEDISVHSLGVIKSTPSGDWADVVARMQMKHFDCFRTMFVELGIAHSLFLNGRHERNIRVVCHAAREDR